MTEHRPGEFDKFFADQTTIVNRYLQELEACRRICEVAQPNTGELARRTGELKHGLNDLGSGLRELERIMHQLRQREA
jgi:hypothetical protein